MPDVIAQLSNLTRFRSGHAWRLILCFIPHVQISITLMSYGQGLNMNTSRKPSEIISLGFLCFILV
ncbi:hypothetical protein J2Z69_000216 [Paenibacillus shirakamiensis]|uniref:Uncharacterized protein n=1 Tax=Paenibacillus shirakamiensis TaxID=1265935 RepID=A0ABS4JBU8_9BACL|nr:hypothetical protein [Paenibacillus shirakamiensis]